MNSFRLPVIILLVVEYSIFQGCASMGFALPGIAYSSSGCRITPVHHRANTVVSYNEPHVEVITRALTIDAAARRNWSITLSDTTGKIIDEASGSGNGVPRWDSMGNVWWDLVLLRMEQFPALVTIKSQITGKESVFRIEKNSSSNPYLSTHIRPLAFSRTRPVIGGKLNGKNPGLFCSRLISILPPGTV